MQAIQRALVLLVKALQSRNRFLIAPQQVFQLVHQLAFLQVLRLVSRSVPLLVLVNQKVSQKVFL